jgi:hypothetical protein
VEARNHPVRASALAIVAAIALLGCGDDGESELSTNAVARVGDETIDKDDLERQVKTLRRADDAPDGPAERQAAAAQREQLERQALAVLVQTASIEQEAEERGIRVSDAEVRERWRNAIAGQFRDDESLRRFLGGQTAHDMIRQLRLQVLSEAIEDDVREQAEPGEGAAAVRRFREEFGQSWSDRTTCRETYSAPGCPTSETSDDEASP